MRNRKPAVWSRCAPAVLALLLALAPVSPAGAQSVEKSNISFMLDWTIAGTHAPYFIPLDKGYYKAEGLTVKIDRGTGAGNTASNVASGVYDFGWADVTTLIAFNAENPTKELTLVYISFQDPPLAIVSLKPNAVMGIVMYEVFEVLERRVTFWAVRSGDLVS